MGTVDGVNGHTQGLVNRVANEVSGMNGIQSDAEQKIPQAKVRWWFQAPLYGTDSSYRKVFRAIMSPTQSHN